MIKMIIPKKRNIDNSKVINRIGKKVAVSDVAIATGAYVSEYAYIDEDNSLKGRTGWYWVKNKFNDTCVYAVYDDDNEDYFSVDVRDIGVRPALEFSSIDDLTNVVSGELEDFQGLKRGKLYVPLNMGEKSQKELQKLLKEGKMKELPQDKGTFPTLIDSKKYNDYVKPFTKKNNSYYEYNGDLYLLLDVNKCFDGEQTQFNNGKHYKDGDRIFVEVKEAYVYFDEQEKTEDGNYIAYYADMLFSGVPFNHTGVYPENFEASDMGKYLPMYWQELEKLQKVVRDIKNKWQSDLKTNPENNVQATTDSSIEAQKLANYFTQLCRISASLDEKIADLNQKLEEAKKDKQAYDKKIEKFRRLMDNGGTEDGR